MPDPRNNADDAYAAFMGMGDQEWTGLITSLNNGGVLQPEESKGFMRALRERGNPLAVPKPASRPAYIKDKAKVEVDLVNADVEELKAMAKRFMELKEKKDELDEQLKEITKELDGWEDKMTGEVHAGLQERMHEYMLAKGFDLVRVPDLASFWPKPEEYPSVSQNDMPSFIEWLDKEQMGAIAKRTVHPQTLKGWVNDRRRENKPIPPMINTVIKMKIGYRRTNPKK
jgi:hypothetical protein